jgi:hypothetical protein
MTPKAEGDKSGGGLSPVVAEVTQGPGVEQDFCLPRS